MQDIEQRLLSRFKWGLSAELQVPDLETRISILKNKLFRDGVSINENIIEYVAKNIKTNVRELEGAMNRIIAAHSLNKRPITVEEAALSIQDLISEEQNRQIMIEDVLRTISGHFNVTKQDILSSRRHKTIVYPRQIGMYLAKVLTTRSLPEIGRKFRGRDHTTVLHAVRKIEKLIKTNPSIRESITTLENSLKE